jgi:hypothetical protein
VTPQPMAQPPCTVPTALPRYWARIASPINTEPTAHSPPKPRPCSPRVISSCQNEFVNPLKNVKNAYQASESSLKLETAVMGWLSSCSTEAPGGRATSRTSELLKIEDWSVTRPAGSVNGKG